MSAGRSGRDETLDADTPPTRSYVDALAQGSLSLNQLADLRAEIVSDGNVLPPDDDELGGQTRFHTYTAEERRSARPEADDDEDGQQTRFHSYTPEERRSARPDAADDDDEPRTRFRAYTEEERRSARPDAADDDDDDARTLFRAPSRQPPVMPAGLRPSDRAPHAAPPVSSVPPRSAPPVSSVAPRSAPPVSSDRAPRSAPPVSSDRAPRSAQPVPPARKSDPPLIEIAMPPSLPRPWATDRPSSGPAARTSSDRAAPSSAPTPQPFDVEVPISAPTPQPIDLEVPLSVPTPVGMDAQVIEKTYLDTVGGPRGLPRLAVSPAQLTKLPLNHQAGLLLSNIDGQSTVDDLIDISPLCRLDTLRILHELVQQGIVTVSRR